MHFSLTSTSLFVLSLHLPYLLQEAKENPGKDERDRRGAQKDGGKREFCESDRKLYPPLYQVRNTRLCYPSFMCFCLEFPAKRGDIPVYQVFVSLVVDSQE